MREQLTLVPEVGRLIVKSETFFFVNLCDLKRTRLCARGGPLSLTWRHFIDGGETDRRVRPTQQ